MPLSIAQLFVSVSADVGGAMTGLGQVEDRMQRAASSIKSAGTTLSAGVTVPLVALGAGVIKFGTGFEDAFTKVRKTVDLSAEDLKVLETGLRALATVEAGGGKTAEELAAIASIAGQLGIEGADNLLKFTGVIARLSGATGLAEEQIATDLAGIASVTGTPVAEWENMASAITDLGNKMGGKESEIIELTKRLSGTLSTVGVSTQDILGVASAMSDLRINAEAGGTAISRFFVDMTAAAGEADGSLAKFAGVAGVTVEQFDELVKSDPSKAFVGIIEGINRIRLAEGPAAALAALEAIGVEGSLERDAILRLAKGNDKLTKALGISNTAWAENTALNTENARAMEATSKQWGLLANTLKEEVIKTFDLLKPSIMDAFSVFRTEVIPRIQQAVEWFRALSPDMQKNALLWAGIAAAAGPALIILGAVASVLAALLSPIGLVVLAIAGLALAWATNMGDIQGKTAAVVGFVMGKFDEIRPFLGKLFSFFTSLWVLEVTVAERAMREIAGFFDTILLPAFKQVGTWIGDFIMGPFLGLMRWIQGIWDQIFPRGATTDDATRAMLASQGIILGEGQSAAGLFDAGIRSGDLALAKLSQEIGAGGPGTANSVIVNINNPTIPDQTVAERLAAEIKDQIMWAMIEAEGKSVVPPMQALPGVPF